MDIPEKLRSLEDRCAIERQIGAGGMATVYLARDLKHDREVALKVLRADLSAVIGSERFLSEVRIAAKLDHPHILTLIDSGSADGILYYVLPYVRGESLRAKLDREKQLSVPDALSITTQVASALDYGAKLSLDFVAVRQRRCGSFRGGGHAFECGRVADATPAKSTVRARLPTRRSRGHWRWFVDACRESGR